MTAPKKNTAFTFTAELIDSAARPALRVNPTLAAGDVKVSIDDGVFGNITTLPTVTPAGGRKVKVSLTAAEMNGDRIDVQFVDVAGDEWDDVTISIMPTVQTVDDVLPTATYVGPDNATISAIAAKTSQLSFSGANVNASIDAITAGVITSAAFTVSAITGVASGILEKIDQTWRRWFKKTTFTRTQAKTWSGGSVLTTQAVSDDGTTQTIGDAT